MKKLYKITALFLLLSIVQIAQLFAVTIQDDTVSGVNRYAVYVGCNYGGKSRERLLYAGSDAQSFKVAMAEIGGVTEENSRILIDPTKNSIDKALSEISEAITENAGNSKRSEFIFYYSGHSDENSLLLGDAKYDYSKLKSAISAVPSDIHVVILDSCYSGNFIRTKGGQKRKPFLIDDSSVVTGHAYLSSSSDNESSQESDEIESSYFTNAMITGLRGAADTSGDNKVTLNELYSYAFNDTLSKTESSKAGPQHPNYNITLVGSGDLVLSDLTAAEAMLSLSKDSKGKFIIRDSNDKLISEINKVEGQPIFIALPRGQYSALIIDEYSTKQGTFLLEKDQVYVLDQNSLSTIKRKSARLRGDGDSDNSDFLSLDDLEDTKKTKTKKAAGIEAESDDEDNNDDDDEDEFLDLDFDFDKHSSDESSEISENSVHKERDYYLFADEPFMLQFAPGVNLVNGTQENSMFAVGIVGSLVNNNNGIQVSNIFNIAKGDILGAQVAGIFNIAPNSTTGAQVAGLFNIGDDSIGTQVGGLYNITTYMTGSQVAGFMNITKKIEGSQIAGFGNISQQVDGMQVSGFVNATKSISGLQLSGFINTASVVDGLQLGIVNIARENNGTTIGLINYVENGLHDFGISIDSDDCVDLFYQGGTKHLFTTFGFAHQRESFFEDKGFGAIYLGAGTEVPLRKTSFDFEFLWKIVYNDKIGKKQSAQDIAFCNAAPQDKIHQVSIPTGKITWNFFESDYARLFAACSFNVHVKGWNDYAFDIYKKSWTIDTAEEYKISPTFSFGVKLKV